VGWIGNQSFDAIAGPITNLFDFNGYDWNSAFDRTQILDPKYGGTPGRVVAVGAEGRQKCMSI
jgi:hypothetical protein